MDADCALLESVGADFVFAPSVEEMYPEPDSRKFSYPPVDTVMEGAFRPGHFNGVCQIVSKLFAIVEPDRAYFGEKDFQQIAVIRAMVEDLHLKVEIVPCPVVREKSGLAMSSRNTLLTDREKAVASHIFGILSKKQEFCHEPYLERDPAICGGFVECHSGTGSAIFCHSGWRVFAGTGQLVGFG